MDKYDSIRDIGPKLKKFAAAMDQTLAELDHDHPDRPVLEGLAAAWHRQRDAVSAAVKQMTAHTKEQVAQARETFADLKKNLEGKIAEAQDLIAKAEAEEAAKAAAKDAPPVPPPPPIPPVPPVVDRKLGTTLAEEVLEKFGGPKPPVPLPPPGKGKDIWEDWH